MPIKQCTLKMYRKYNLRQKQLKFQFNDVCPLIFSINSEVVRVIKCNVGVLFYFVTFWLKLNSMALVRKQNIPTEGPPLVGEVSANFCG
jgi:hypothetical protein